MRKSFMRLFLCSLTQSDRIKENWKKKRLLEQAEERKEIFEELGCKLSDSFTPSCSGYKNGAEKKAVNSVRMETAGNSEETRKSDEEKMKKRKITREMEKEKGR